MDQIEKIIPVKIPRGMAISLGKRIASFKRNCCGVSEEMMGPSQPERSKREDEHLPPQESFKVKVRIKDVRCGALNIVETQ